MYEIILPNVHTIRLWLTLRLEQKDRVVWKRSQFFYPSTHTGKAIFVPHHTFYVVLVLDIVYILFSNKVLSRNASIVLSVMLHIILSMLTPC